MSPQEKVCIVGAGSSGITAAKALKEQGIPFDCLEKGSGVGGNWRYRNDNGLSAAYASLHINTSKTRMAYSDFPMPDDYPTFSSVMAYRCVTGLADRDAPRGSRAAPRASGTTQRIPQRPPSNWNDVW